jgi:predicted oxidoreductase
MNPNIPAGASRRLGQGLTVSPMAWGMWRFQGGDVAAARVRVEAALEGGPFGAAEALLGKVLAEARSLRDRFVLAGKGGIEPGSPYNAGARYLVGACEASLTRLGAERIDLYQIHRPDTLAHPGETAEALTLLRAAGKIAEAGVSNHTPAQVAALQAHLPFPLVAVQPEFSPLHIAPLYDGVLDLALERDLAVLAWSPLGGGRLARGEGRPALIETLDRLALEAGVTRSAYAYAWIMRHPARPIPIVGTQDPERIRAAAAALSVRIARSDWYAVLTAARGEPLP